MAAIIEGGLAYSVARGFADPLIIAPIALFFVVSLVTYGLWMNRTIKSLWLAALGLALNAFAITMNGAQMPVSEWALEYAGLSNLLSFMQSSSDAVHKLIDEHTRYWFLTDVIPVRLFRNVISVGDVFLLLSVLLFFPEATQRVIRNRRA